MLSDWMASFFRSEDETWQSKKQEKKPTLKASLLSMLAFSAIVNMNLYSSVVCCGYRFSLLCAMLPQILMFFRFIL